MATVIRVKRRIDEEPLNAFVLNCKKRKYNEVDDQAATSSESADETSATVVKFAGTVNDQKNIASHIKKLTKSEAVDVVNRVRHPPSLVARNRSTQKTSAQEDRFKIVNCFRTLDGDDEPSITSTNANAGSSTSQSPSALSVPPNLTVVDIERNPSTLTTSASSSMPTLFSSTNITYEPPTDEAEEGFVYDLYLPDMALQNPHMDLFVEDLLSVEPLNDLTYGSARDNGINESSDDSEDSNDEGNWRNEYPDTEEDNDDNDSITERTMRTAFKSMDIDDLSSDDDERGACGRQNGFVYTIEPEGLGIGEYGADVDRYGKAYARYKSRIVKKNRITLGGDDDDDADGVSDDYDDRNGRSVNSSSTCLDDDYYSD